jgi:hypothetical protein
MADKVWTHVIGSLSGRAEAQSTDAAAADEEARKFMERAEAARERIREEGGVKDPLDEPHVTNGLQGMRPAEFARMQMRRRFAEKGRGMSRGGESRGDSEE